MPNEMLKLEKTNGREGEGQTKASEGEKKEGGGGKKE